MQDDAKIVQHFRIKWSEFFHLMSLTERTTQNAERFLSKLKLVYSSFMFKVIAIHLQFQCVWHFWKKSECFNGVKSTPRNANNFDVSTFKLMRYFTCFSLHSIRCYRVDRAERVNRWKQKRSGHFSQQKYTIQVAVCCEQLKIGWTYFVLDCVVGCSVIINCFFCVFRLQLSQFQILDAIFFEVF